MKTFLVYRRVEGRPERITIGRFPAVKIEQARTEAMRINGAIAERRNPQSERRRERQAGTLADAYYRRSDLDAFVARRTRTQTP